MNTTEIHLTLEAIRTALHDLILNGRRQLDPERITAVDERIDYLIGVARNVR